MGLLVLEAQRMAYHNKFIMIITNIVDACCVAIENRNERVIWHCECNEAKA